MYWQDVWTQHLLEVGHSGGSTTLVLEDLCSYFTSISCSSPETLPHNASE